MKTNMDKKSASRLWQKTKYANLVRNASSGKYFARFRSNGKLIWRGLDTDVLSIAAQRLSNRSLPERKREDFAGHSPFAFRIALLASRKAVRTFAAASCWRSSWAESVAFALSGSARPHRN